MVVDNDNGYASRKFWLSVITLVVILGGGMIAGAWGGFAPEYDALIMGVLGTLSIYCGVNVATKWVGKAGQITTQSQDKPEGDK